MATAISAPPKMGRKETADERAEGEAEVYRRGVDPKSFSAFSDRRDLGEDCNGSAEDKRSPRPLDDPEGDDHQR